MKKVAARLIRGMASVLVYATCLGICLCLCGCPGPQKKERPEYQVTKPRLAPPPIEEME